MPIVALSNPRLRSLASRTAVFRNSASPGAALAQQTAPTHADVIAALGELGRAFSAFREANDNRIAAVERGRGDVVQDEQTARIGAEVVALQQLTETLSAQLAAARVGGVGGAIIKPDVANHSDAFNAWFRRGDLPGNSAAALRELEVKAALSTDSQPDGGFIVPESVETEITRIVGTVSRIRELARVITISTGVHKKLHNLGGAGSGWVGEQDSRPETTTPTLSELDFPVMELYAQPGATATLLADGRLDIGGWLGEEVSITFAEQEGLAFVTGNGVKRPRGLVSYTNVPYASWSWGNIGYVASGVAAALTDGSNNGFDALKRLTIDAIKSAYTANATFVMNRNTLFTVSAIKDLEGNYLWQPSNQVGVPSQLLGYPVAVDDNMPTIAAGAFPIAFGDIRRGYLVVDRAGIVVLRDPYTKKPWVLFYTTKRVGGGVQDFDAFKLIKIATS